MTNIAPADPIPAAPETSPVTGTNDGDGLGDGRGNGESKGKRRRAIFLLLSVVVSLVVIYATPLRQYLELERAAKLADDVRGKGPLGPIVFAGITMVGVMIGAPRLFFAGLGGYLFGFWPGFLSAQIGTLIGSIITFVYGRALGADYVAARIGPRFHRLDAVLKQVGQHGIMTNVLIRNIPIGNSFMMTLAMSVTGMPLRDFTIGTFLGTAPEAALCAYFGNTRGSDLQTRLIVCAIVVVLLAVVSWFGLRRTRLAKALRATR